MKTVALPALVFVCGIALTGCVHRQPLISHAHVGHCLTSWRDTPHHQGLLPVARQELETARREADAALAENLGAAQKTAHIRNVARALNPDAEGLGPGLGYGAIRALEAALEHLEYAATSDDATTNIVAAVAGLSTAGEKMLEQLRSTATRAKSADVRDAASLDRTALELRAALRSIATGSAGGDAGFDQFQAQLDAMLSRETNPKYQPVPQKYLLGLVRLPSGKWRYTSLHKAMAKPNYGH